jgi:hypothetical protein
MDQHIQHVECRVTGLFNTLTMPQIPNYLWSHHLQAFLIKLTKYGSTYTTCRM